MRVHYSNMSGYYEGDVRGSNIPTGFGTQFFNNGNRYDGFFLEGKRRGYGEALIGKRLIYRGEWVDNKRHGCGYARYDGLEYDCEYIGYFVKDHPHGFGVCFFNNGDVYVGEWDHGQRHGKGTYIYFNKALREEGWWNHGKRHGVFFEIEENNIVEKKIYRNDSCIETKFVAFEDRLLNNLSGIYGRLEKNGKTYYGKYLPYKCDGGCKNKLQGWALEYNGALDWNIAMYQYDVRHGESVYFGDEGIDQFERCFFVDGKQVGPCIQYEGTGVTCHFYTDEDEDGIRKSHGIQYDNSDQSLYIGELCCDVPHGVGVYYSFETRMLSTVQMSYSCEEHRDDMFKTDDVFGYCYTVEKGSYLGSAIDASEKHFLAGKVSYSFLTGEKSLNPDCCYFFDRAKGDISFSSPDGTQRYFSNDLGERSYFIGNEVCYVMSAEGDLTLTQIKNHEKTLLCAQDGRLYERGYALSAGKDDLPEWGWSESNGGCCVSFRKEHTKDLITRHNMSYNGATTGNPLSPCGYGAMTFPGFGIANGKWRGYLDCDNATFFSYATGKAECVTIEDGIITFPNGKIFNYTKYVKSE